MGLGLKPAQRRGRHYRLASLAVRRLGSANLLVKGKSEAGFELSVIAHLQGSPELRRNMITQVGAEEVEKITQARLFGFKHRPDTTIGRDGTAIEIKVVSHGGSIRELLGQAIAYRTAYRFVILVMVDETEDREVVRLCGERNSPESKLLRGLSREFNIFSIVGPRGQSKNLVFD